MLTTATSASFDLIGLGEILVEFSRVDERLWRQSWAGDVGNTLWHAARLGLRTGLVTTFGSDPFTAMIVDGVRRAGIDTAASIVDPDRPNGIYLIELDRMGERTLHFRRSDAAARRTLERIDSIRFVEGVGRSRWFLLSAITLAVMGEREKLESLLRELRARDVRIAFDANHRPALWPSTAEYRDATASILPLVDLFLPSRDDLLAGWPTQSAEETLRALGHRRVAMTDGADGCLLLWDERSETIPADRAVVVDTTGAGDAFNAGFIAELLKSDDPVEAARRGCAMAAGIVGVTGARGSE